MTSRRVYVVTPRVLTESGQLFQYFEEVK